MVVSVAVVTAVGAAVGTENFVEVVFAVAVVLMLVLVVLVLAVVVLMLVVVVLFGVWWELSHASDVDADVV